MIHLVGTEVLASSTSKLHTEGRMSKWMAVPGVNTLSRDRPEPSDEQNPLIDKVKPYKAIARM